VASADLDSLHTSGRLSFVMLRRSVTKAGRGQIDKSASPPAPSDAAGRIEALARRNLSILIFAMIAVFLIGAAIYSLFVGSFETVGAVWAAVAPIAGALVHHYYRLHGQV
jgi:uncharacterized membrane protein